MNAVISRKQPRFYKLLASFVLLTVAVGLTSCNQGENAALSAVTEFNTIEWTDLMPAEDLEALLNPPEFLSSIIDGSSEDQIESQIQTTLENAPETAYEKALVSANIVPEYDSKNIRLPGFVVPLEFNEDFVVTEFFLVPYFGACLHTPPPPPNQIVFVQHSDGFTLESLEQPYWVSGLLTTQSEVNDMAHAAYTLAASEITPYDVMVEE